MKDHKHLFSPKTGIIGVIIIVCGILLTALPYRGLNEEFFNPLNHFISELGEYGLSAFAFIFNASLLVGGICVMLFMIGIMQRYKDYLIKIAAFFGALAALGTALIGVFPVNNLPAHLNAAGITFLSSMLSSLLFSAGIVTRNSADLPKWLVLPGSITTVLCFLFITLPRLLPEWTLDPHFQTRPEIWAYTILEWITFATMMLWVFVITKHIKE